MDAEEFYEAFKDAIRYLGYSWFDKEKLTVKFKDGKFILKDKDREAVIKIKGKSE